MGALALGEPVFPLPRYFLTRQDRYFLENGPIDIQNFEAFHTEESNERQDGECPICFDDLDPSDPTPTLTGNTAAGCRNLFTLRRCEHRFHKDCFEHGARARLICPYCRTPLLSTPDELHMGLIRMGFTYEIYRGDYDYHNELPDDRIWVDGKQLSSTILWVAYTLVMKGSLGEPSTMRTFTRFNPVSEDACRKIVEGIIKAAKAHHGTGRELLDLAVYLFEESRREMTMFAADLSTKAKIDCNKFGWRVAELAVNTYAKHRGILPP